MPLLKVDNLKTYFHTRNGVVKAVDDVSFLLKKGEILGIVGESGSGKSVSVLSLIQLIPNPPGEVSEGEIYYKGEKIFDGKDLNEIKAIPLYRFFDGINKNLRKSFGFIFFIAWMILKCSTVTLIGINHGWEEDDSWDTIMRHGTKDLSINIDKNSSSFQKLFPKVFNPDIGKYCVLDPIFQFYSTALKEFISRSPSWLTTINATEGGSIFGERIICQKFTEFLNQHE